MSRPQSYKNLEIYKLAHKLAVEVHEMTLSELPKFELYEEGNQIRKSSKSVCSNIVEGFGRKRYQQEYIRFLTFAIASCDETREHLDLIFETCSLKDRKKYDNFLRQYEELGKKIYRFQESIARGLKLVA